MADEDLDFDRIDHEIRINELKERAREATGGEMHAFETEDDPDDPARREIREAFWENVVRMEEGGWVSSRRQLQAAGVALPSPEELTDEQVSAKLREVIERLAGLRTYLYSTDHLSDRELYTELCDDVLDDSVPEAIANSPTGAHIIDMVGSGSEEDTYLYMKYYADEATRRRWHEEWPDDEMPPRETPPYDRDRHLPRPPEEQGPPRRAARPQDVPVDLKEIVDGMEMQGDEVHGYYDCDTGQTVFVQDEYARMADDPDLATEREESMADWEQEEIATARAVSEDEADRFVALPDRFDIHEWDMMRQFAEGRSDAALADRLLNAIHGKGAFRRFKDVLYGAGIEEQWFAFRDQAFREIALDWCQWHHIAVKPEKASDDS